MDCSAVAVQGIIWVTSAVMPTTSVPLPLDAAPEPAVLDGDELEQPAASRAAAAEPTASALAPRRLGFFIDPPKDRGGPSAPADGAYSLVEAILGELISPHVSGMYIF